MAYISRCPACWEDGKLTTKLRAGICFWHGDINPNWNKEEKKMKKYYVGAKHIADAIRRGSNADCMQDTYEEAVKVATGEVERGEVAIAVIVKVIAIVRRSTPPVIVEPVE